MLSGGTPPRHGTQVLLARSEAIFLNELRIGAERVRREQRKPCTKTTAQGQAKNLRADQNRGDQTGDQKRRGSEDTGPSARMLSSGDPARELEPPSGIEPETYALRMRCSTS